MSGKIYCYVDESGQDTEGQTFFVACVIVTAECHQEAILVCERAEEVSSKKQIKWSKATIQKRTEYIKHLLYSSFPGLIYFSNYKGTRKYSFLRDQTIAWAVQEYERQKSYDKVTVLIDGMLEPLLMKETTRNLRHLGLKIKKVRGVNKEANDTLTRLADAISGLARGAQKGRQESTDLFDEALSKGLLKQLP